MLVSLGTEQHLGSTRLTADCSLAALLHCTARPACEGGQGAVSPPSRAETGTAVSEQASDLDTSSIRLQ